MKELYVVNCCRTAVGSFGGSLKNTPAAELGAIVVKEALKRANVAPENVDELMFGCILTSGLGQNVARQVGVGAGLPYSVPAYTVGMVCGSGMKSVIEAGRAILAGDADIIVCGGTENMSAAPYASTDARWGARMGDKKLVDTMIKDGLWDAFNNYHMGTTAENICDVWGITREELDAFGAASQQKTEAAQASGRFDAEIVPVPVKVKKEIVEFKKDEFPRAGSTPEGLAKLKGAFPVGPEGVEDQIVHTFQPTEIHEADTRKHVQRVTAGNASGINDGAAAIVLASGEAVKKYNLKPMAKLIGWGQGGVDPKIMGVGPVPASRQAMAKAGVTIDDIDLVEANEAFAAQSIAVARELHFDMSKVNVNGGAISIGHPVGCSGARIIVDATHPFATLASGNIRAASLAVGARCLRLARPVEALPKGVVPVASIACAARFLSENPGRVLLTTGSKELAPYTHVADFAERFFVRVLPLPGAITKCIDAGFSPSHVIGMQGPFTRELNEAMLRQVGAQWLVTKDSGTVGGTAEKLAAARAVGARCVVVTRPAEGGGALSLREVEDALLRELAR